MNLPPNIPNLHFFTNPGNVTTAAWNSSLNGIWIKARTPYLRLPSRARYIAYDIREKFWALDAVLDEILSGTEAMRGKIARLPA
jgi:hypothetical protein